MFLFPTDDSQANLPSYLSFSPLAITSFRLACTVIVWVLFASKLSSELQEGCREFPGHDGEPGRQIIKEINLPNLKQDTVAKSLTLRECSPKLKFFFSSFKIYHLASPKSFFRTLIQFCCLCKVRLPPKVVFHQKPSSTEGCLPSKVVFHRRSSFTKGCLPPKVVFYRWSSSIEGCLPPKVVFLQRSSSIKNNTLVHLIFVRTVNIPNLSLLPCLEMVFHQMSSSTKGCPPPEVIFHQRPSSTEVHLQPTMNP